MDDLIRRSDVIGLLEDMLLFGEYDIIASSFSKADEEKAYRAIDDIPAVNRWIPCSERMPAEWQIVAAYGEKIGLKCVEWHPEMGVFIDTQSEYDDQIKPEYFTRWIPLTEHPEKE